MVATVVLVGPGFAERKWHAAEVTAAISVVVPRRRAGRSATAETPRRGRQELGPTAEVAAEVAVRDADGRGRAGGVGLVGATAGRTSSVSPSRPAR